LYKTHLMRVVILSFFVYFSSLTLLHAQTTYIPFDDDYYHIIDRYNILNGEEGLLNTSIKPYNRAFADSFSLKLSMQQQTEADAFNWNFFEQDNWEALPDRRIATMQKNKPKWKNFYQFQNSFFSVYEPDFKLIVNPVLGFASGQQDVGDSNINLYQSTRGAEIRGSIGNKIGFYTFVSENQFAYPNYQKEDIEATSVIQGAGYIKSFGNGGYDFFNARGYITFKPIKQIQLQFGHDKNFIGNGYRSLILNDFAKENLFLKFQTSVWRINYMNLFSELTDFRSQSTVDGQNKKYAALHYLNISIIPGKLDVGFFENIIFGRNDSTRSHGYEINYLNPIIFYRAVEHGLNSTDNALAGMDWRWNFAKGMQFYGQFLLDEFVQDELLAREGSWRNKWAFQGGLKAINLFTIPNLDLQVETNMVRPYTYTHYKEDQNYAHFGQPMAHPFGANFREVLAILRYQPIGRLNLTAKYFNIVQGLDSSRDATTTHFGGDIFKDYGNRPKDVGLKIGDGVKSTTQIIELTASYQMMHRTYFDVRFIMRNSSRELPYTDRSSAMLLLGLRMNLAQQKLDF
jgi:hypothetical protein